MACKNPEREALIRRGAVRTYRHGNWRQVYIDCGGMCIARVNGSEYPCGETESLEFHEMWGEGEGKFQQRILLCNFHHGLIGHTASTTQFTLWQYKASQLQWDANLEVLLAGGLDKWVLKHKLDGSRWGTLLYSGPEIEVDADMITLAERMYTDDD